MIFINEDITSSFQDIETEIYEANKIVERFQRRIIFLKIKNNYEQEYIEKQRRIQRLKNPFNVAIGILKEIVGKENHQDEKEIVIDPSIIEEELKITSEIMNVIDYKQLIIYFHDTIQFGLVKTNNQWSQDLNK